MSTPFSKTTVSAKADSVNQDWFVIDATDLVLGRLATETARRLRGKHKPEFTPHVDTGDYIVIINAEKVKVTGRKRQQKVYYRHTGYPGGIKKINFHDLQKSHPERAIEHAVKGMIPHTPLGRAMLRKLKVYKGDQHPHASQQPQLLDLKDK
jgi:large subunit ribosomal protein L13